MFKIPGRQGIFSAFLVSPAVVKVLLLILIFLSILGTCIPQEAVYPPEVFSEWQKEYPGFASVAIATGLTRLYSSIIYITTVLLVLLSLAICTCQRSLILFRKGEKEICYLGGKFTSEVQLPLSVSKSHALVKGLLRKARYRITSDKSAASDEVSFTATKGRFGVFGSLIFHGSFLLIFFGVLLSTWTCLEGKFLLTEGQTFTGLPHEYRVERSPVLKSDKIPPFEMHLEKFMPSASGNTVNLSRVLITENDGSKFRRTIRPFHALSHGGYTFYQQGSGFSPALKITDQTGHVLFDALVAFHAKKINDEVLHEDVIDMPWAGMQLTGHLYPEAEYPQGVDAKNSSASGRPVLKIRISEKNREIFQGIIPFGGEINFKDLSISFYELRYWSGFRLVKDSGIPYLYAGFLVGVAGLMLRIFSSGEIVAVLIGAAPNGAKILLEGSSERDQALFINKFDQLTNKIKKIASHPTGVEDTNGWN